MIDTKQKILDTAERLIGEQGYSGTSLRHIIAEAGVNLAAVHYHFGSKEELLDELVMRKAVPVNAERMARLDRLEAHAGRTPTVTQVLEAFLMPVVEVAERNPQFVRLMGRLVAEGLMQSIVQKHFQAVSLRFFELLRMALPKLPEEELMWRMHFGIGAMVHTMCGTPDNTGVSGGSFHDRMVRLIAYMTGGLQAPVPRHLEAEVKR